MSIIMLLLANIKTVLIAIAGLLGIGFLANYARRGKQLEANRQAIKAYKAKEEVRQESQKIEEKTKEKIDEVKKASGNDLVNKLNNLD